VKTEFVPDLRIIILGESVSWGQGLLREHKHAYLVQKAFTNSSVEALIEMHAHSGAYLGISHSGRTTSIDSEIPNPAPLIVNQLDGVKDPSTTDIVLMHGRVNDIGLSTILSPLTPTKKLYELIRSVFFQDMRVFLRKMIQVFRKPNCRYVVGGYYPILSHDSRLLIGGELDPALELFLKIKGIKLPSGADKALVTNQMIIRALQFWHESASALQQAVNEVASEANLGKRLVFVPAPMNESNALFAGDPWLWGIKNDRPEDEVFPEREQQCNTQYGAGLPREVCHFASVGHPNVKAAAKFARAIKIALDSI
jgi:hypothetical protein